MEDSNGLQEYTPRAGGSSISSGHASDTDELKQLAQPIEHATRAQKHLLKAARQHADVKPQAKAERKLNRLCDQLGLQGEERTAYAEVFKRHMDRLTEGLTPDEQDALTALSAKVGEMAKLAPTARGKAAQFANSTASATIAWATGFGMVTLLVKTLALSPLRGNAIHFVNVAGPLILLMGEVMSGRYRALGAGYAALDNTAYLTYSTAVSQKKRAELALDGARRATPADDKLVEKLAGQVRACQVKVQELCVALFRREMGHAFDPDNPHDGVPQSLMKCIRSGIGLGDAGAVHLADGTHLFTVKPDQDKTTLTVVWSDGTETDLMAQPVPDRYQDLFSRAEDALLGAARCRSALTDELPFMLFGLFYVISGAAGPWIVANAPAGDAGAAAADVCLSLAMCWCGTEATLHAQNAMRSVYTGAPVSPGVYPPLQEARYDELKLQIAGIKARIADMDATRSGLNKRIVELERQSASGTDADNHKAGEDLRKTQAVLDKLKLQGNELVKQLRAAKAQLDAASSHTHVVWTGARTTWQGYRKNLPQLTAKLVGYTATYIAYSQAFMYGVNMLIPTQPAPQPFGYPNGGDFANATNFSNFTNTTYAAPGVPPEAWHPYMTAFAFNGFAMALGFVVRNNPIARSLEYAGNWVAGQVERQVNSRASPTQPDADPDADQVVVVDVSESVVASASQDSGPAPQSSRDSGS